MQEYIIPECILKTGEEGWSGLIQKVNSLLASPEEGAMFLPFEMSPRNLIAENVVKLPQWGTHRFKRVGPNLFWT